MNELLKTLMFGALRPDRAVARNNPQFQDPTTGDLDTSGTYGMGGLDQGSDFQPAPQAPTDPSMLEEIMAAGELAKRGMMQEAKQLYDQAMWRAQRTVEKPMVQDGIGMAEDAYGAVTDLFK